MVLQFYSGGLGLPCVCQLGRLEDVGSPDSVTSFQVYCFGAGVSLN